MCLAIDQTPTVADAFLAACRGMWGQPFVAAIYTLLLHRWLLERRDAGGLEQRQKHLNVLVAGKALQRNATCDFDLVVRASEAQLVLQLLMKRQWIRTFH